MTKLILFDIDGTLIDSGEAGVRSLDYVFNDVFAIRDAFAGIEMAGKTDIQIIKEGLNVHSILADDGILISIVSGYIVALKAEINNKRKHIKPGVVKLLGAIKSIDGYFLGLLTGNIEQGARIKLAPFGLNEYFSIGAFGSDNEDRNSLLPIAVKKFRKATKIDLQYIDCIVIGDTPKDVQCSKPFGATSIAVSTGPYSYESLLGTGADYVLENLSHAMELVDEFKEKDCPTMK
jgi:phosphoglycolate phosphatase-like HAD superfamily hydrolase